MHLCLGLALGLALLGATLAPAQTATRWNIDDPDFGGFSGLHLSDDGRRFTAITDRGTLYEGRVTRVDGEITDINSIDKTRLRNDDGNALTKFRSDAEGLAITPDGRLYVSFEQYHRVWTYSSPQSEGAWLPRHSDFKTMQSNSSLEALAIDADGALYTIPERSGSLKTDFPVYKYQNNTWTIPFTVRRDGPYLPIGADFGPDGMLYILERYFTGFSFKTRVRRFDASGGSEETVLTTASGQFDNLEGISVWETATGQIRITMISDDNFRFFQRTQFVEYTLP
jgi:hypothetical protein